MATQTMSNTRVEKLKKLFEDNAIYAFEPNGPTEEGMKHIKKAEQAAAKLAEAGAEVPDGERERIQQLAAAKWPEARQDSLPTSCFGDDAFSEYDDDDDD